MILTLSGWGQKFDSLKVIFRNQNFDPSFFAQNPIIHFDYTKFNNTQDFFKEIKFQNLNPKMVIGWSLGGQLAIRLIEKKIITPKTLILIAPPFQMVKDKKISTAMSKKTYEEFYQSFSTSPTKTLKQFSILTAMNDKHAKEITKTLDINDKNQENLKFWLEELKNFTCFNVDFTDFPTTIFCQGSGDMIVHPNQTQYFQARIKDFTLEQFPNCGHAPHLNDPDKVTRIISVRLL
ncbi:MAG: alpha/beta hydrolase [Rickettsiales bacterium]|nr:alpha/beta hydrolase [Rickettsiales bacterium]